MRPPSPPPDNRRLLLGLTAATVVLTILLIYVARPSGSAVALAVVSAGLAAAGSAGITASATSFRRLRERRARERGRESSVQRWAEPQRQAEPQPTQPQLPPEQRLRLLENERRQIQQDLMQLSQKERREGGLTQEDAEFRERLQIGLDSAERLIGELRRQLGRDQGMEPA